MLKIFFEKPEAVGGRPQNGDRSLQGATEIGKYEVELYCVEVFKTKRAKRARKATY